MNPLTLRLWHFYISMFIAPSILFFALTGAMQLFSLHESHGSYDPPAILEKLGKVHKDQVFETRPKRMPAPDAVPAPAAADGALISVGPVAASSPAAPGPQEHHEKRQMKISTMVLKWFFLVVALGLTVSTCFGLWIGLVQSRRKRTGVVLFIVGAVIPIALLFA